MTGFKIVTIQECEFENQIKDGCEDYKNKLAAVKEEVETTFIPPRDFYTGGKNLYKISFNLF